MIFVSCGQFTQAEKNLGKSICELVRAVTDMKTFFAEEVQDLIGLDTNILQHLREAAGFITVLHPRGIIIRPDGSHLIRASVWIEQEIAIATYIQQMERHPLPVIAFVHKSVTLEGIRTLLNLNPIVFEHEQEVLAALPARLQAWKTLKPAGISIKVKSINYRSDRDHFVSDLVFSIVNDTDKRIKEFNCEIRIPAVLLQHENYYYGDILIQSNDPRYKVFRINEKMTGLIEPRQTKNIYQINYCTKCSGKYDPVIALGIGAESIEADLWVNDRHYHARQTIIEISNERESHKP